tara:strand:+ start:686 stop:1285 length:600 start_codon:yes stop_codon:yes gene_type:complete
MKEFLLPEHTNMGGWFIPKSTVKKIIKFWHNPKYQEYKKQGISKTYNNEANTDSAVKESTELQIFVPVCDWQVIEPWGEYLDHLQKCLDNYLIKYPFANNVSTFSLEPSFNLQHYKKNGGFKRLHQENKGCAESGRRHLVFTTYLNDIENGGTEFPVQDVITPSIEGLTVIFPAYFTHPHKSQVSHDSEKMIVTGWWTF